jgi:hypothetical protein
MKKIILTVFLCTTFLLQSRESIYAWYGAGYTKGWPNTVNGLRGKVVDPLYQVPPAFYETNDVISLSFTIESQRNNPRIVSENLYLKIWRVDGQDAENKDLTEETLYTNHNEGSDSQTPYKTQTVGELTLAPGETSSFAVDITIDEPGYYQFDLTDLSDNDFYRPGHIYAAGFLRVKEAQKLAATADQTPKHDGLSFFQKLSSYQTQIVASLLLLLMTVILYAFKKLFRTTLHHDNEDNLVI